MQPGSSFHVTECFGPVLGVMRAADLDEAIGLQNMPLYGLTAGLFSRDEREIKRGIAEAERTNDVAALVRLKQEKLELDRKLAAGLN